MTKKTERLSLQKRLHGITMPISRKRIKWGRNWPCLCGSDKKYKGCCMTKIDSLTFSDGNAKVTKLPEDIQKMVDAQIESQRKEGLKKNG